MDFRPRLIVWGSIIGIILVTSLSSPLIPIELMPEQSPSAFFSNETDSINISIVEPPPNPLVFSKIGDEYVPQNSTAVVRITNLTGTPPITYRLDIPALGKVYVAPFPTNQSLIGQPYRLTIRSARITADQPLNDTYQGTVRLQVWTGQSKRILYEANVTVVLDG